MVVLPVSFAAMGLVIERGLLWVRWLRNRVRTLGRRGSRLADLRAAAMAAVAEEVTAELRAGLATGTRPADAADSAAIEPVEEGA